MAVVLEAYLLGCGQAMLHSFRQQVKAVEVLQEVAKTTKSLFPDKTDLPVTGEAQSVLYYDCGIVSSSKHMIRSVVGILEVVEQTAWRLQ